jgi:hypothetical protein
MAPPPGGKEISGDQGAHLLSEFSTKAGGAVSVFLRPGDKKATRKHVPGYLETFKGDSKLVR